MTTLVVDPMVYSLAGSSLYSWATEYQKFYSAQMTALSDTGSMGGNVGESLDWSKSYDTNVSTAMNMTELLITAMGNYASILQELGYSYAYADYEEGSGRPEPITPTPFAPTWLSCVVPPPSASGPNSGLFDDVGFAVGALEQFGCTIPDGEPHKLETAANVWLKFAGTSGVGNLPTLLENLARSFDSETAPELSTVDDDIRHMKDSAERLIGLYTELGNACNQHRTAILDFRTYLGQLLTDLAHDLAEEIAETVILSVIGGALTAGFGAAAIAAAKAGKLAIKLKKYVDRVLEAKRLAKFTKILDKVTEDAQAKKSEIQRIADLLAKRLDELWNKPWNALHKRPDNVPEGWVSKQARGDGVIWQKPGSVGDADTIRVMAPTDRYPNGYVKFTNSHGQPLKLDGKPGSKAETHFDLNADGTFTLPKGW
ncbi:hypothetical protein [Nocardia ignorata]|uniref:Uncharacterized protein n=1 Tax=Nocardia ignorata TaxID=145285 RepID=A0A4R6PTZ1_NOCIG|nr:hypothetical protein [Nocardia ignorata]TDP42308.1 hypothetical protein DFR75_1011418 [Nocardia ignorata]